MSTLTPPKPDAATTAPTRVTLRGPVRVLLRVHRRPLRTGGAAAALVILWMVGLSLWSDRSSADFAASGCSVEHTVPRCGSTVRDFLDVQMLLNDTQNQAGLLLMVLPALVGAFMAGPVIARELESGTFRLSWSQSVSPARWLAARLLAPAVLTVAVTSALAAVFAWFWSRDDDSFYERAWYEEFVYGSLGTVPVAHALLGLAIGTLAGLLVRRTVAAMAATVVASGLLLVAIGALRFSLWPIRTDVVAIRSGYGVPTDSWSGAQGYVTSTGERLPAEVCREPAGDILECLATHGSSERYYDYHPASHFWPLQLVETGILLALASLAVFAAFRVLRRLHG
ncbi:ABC transporter permease [Streptomyces sp. NPDC058542]|uniref:ABC transporter permease n=1 Tax=Streptomyces sp. NPDC058542 TaxID=3346543 RepID=UPI003656DF82